ncbi:MAG TPA: hypothetical protein H9875_01440 [Candidatus Levilactobacillus faecigallinarum]|uniref:Uncharacterized protein n=1 Tax=Candidatus Levilactobacillus faecigallinarum TaxID=2838638 RepID=A0A9D1QQ23_9LACO|nr:hypothetical protein [Candidatus Levilactobacillus faecigallinarum]
MPKSTETMQTQNFKIKTENFNETIRLLRQSLEISRSQSFDTQQITLSNLFLLYLIRVDYDSNGNISGLSSNYPSTIDATLMTLLAPVIEDGSSVIYHYSGAKLTRDLFENHKIRHQVGQTQIIWSDIEEPTPVMS